MALEHWPYLGIFSILIAASLGLPIPEDIPLLTSGYLCHVGLAKLSVMLAVTFVGVLCGDFILFGLGRKLGHHVVEHHVIRRLVRPSRLLMAENLFKQHGVKIIFIGRFLPGLRPMIFMAAGVLKVPPLTFGAVNGLAACISVPILVVLGMVFGANIEQVKTDVRTTAHAVGLVALVAGLITTGIYLHRRQKRMMASTGVQRRVHRETLAHLPPGAGPFDIELEETRQEHAPPKPTVQQAVAPVPVANTTSTSMNE